MLCSETCPRQTKCKPISNIVSENGESFVCMGYHGDEKKKYAQDIFRHCFFTESTDTMYDYDHWDIKSVISVMSEALVIDEIERNV